MKHTPGPWISEKQPYGTLFSIWYDDDTEIAEAYTVEDAQLIALSPSLLSALISSTEWMVSERDAMIDSCSGNDGKLYLHWHNYSHELTDLMNQIRTNEALIKSLE